MRIYDRPVGWISFGLWSKVEIMYSSETLGGQALFLTATWLSLLVFGGTSLDNYHIHSCFSLLIN